MTSTCAVRLIALAGLGPLLAVSSWAQEAGGPLYDPLYGSFYGGLSVGQARGKIDEANISRSVLGTAGPVPGDIGRDDRSVAYKLFGGYQVNRHFAIEAGYFNLGKFGFTTTTAPAGTLDGQIKVQGLNLDLVGLMPLGDRLTALARIGAQYARASGRFTGSGAAVVADGSPSQHETNLKLGVGLQYAFSPSLLVRGEAERYRIPDSVGDHGHVNMMSVSVVFPFGGSSTSRRHGAARHTPVADVYEALPPTAAVPAAAPVAAAPPAPAPAPVVVPAVVPVVAPRPQVSITASTLFGFDEYEVRPEGRGALDTFSKDVGGTPFEAITVEGHTDRIGPPAHNQTLSQQRADSVKSYLVTQGKLDAQKISAVGKGSTVPVTQAGDCKGTARSARLVACLQPDRRVEVGVSPTR